MYNHTVLNSTLDPNYYSKQGFGETMIRLQDFERVKTYEEETKLAQLVTERAQAITKVIQLNEKHGKNAWGDEEWHLSEEPQECFECGSKTYIEFSNMNNSFYACFECIEKG